MPAGPVARPVKPAWATVLGKLESLDPGGSITDRIAFATVEDAERQGRLKPGDTNVEPTPRATPESARPWWRLSRDTG